MKKQLLILAAFLVVNCQLIIDNCFAQQTNQAEQYNSERIKLLQQQLGELKKTSSEEKQQMQAQIDFRDEWAVDIEKLLQTHDIRLMTNKLLIQGTIEGTIMKIKEEQDAAFAGYASTRKIVYAAIAAWLFAGCCFIVALVLIHLRNKKNFLMQQEILDKHYTELESLKGTQEKDSVFQKVALNQLRIEWRLGAETRTKAIEDIRLQLENITAAAAAHKKLSEERTTSLAYFQQQMEDKLDAINRSADGMTDELKKEIKNMEQRISAVEIIKAQLKPKN